MYKNFSDPSSHTLLPPDTIDTSNGTHCRKHVSCVPEEHVGLCFLHTPNEFDQTLQDYCSCGTLDTDPETYSLDIVCNSNGIFVIDYPAEPTQVNYEHLAMACYAS